MKYVTSKHNWHDFHGNICKIFVYLKIARFKMHGPIQIEICVAVSLKWEAFYDANPAKSNTVIELYVQCWDFQMCCDLACSRSIDGKIKPEKGMHFFCFPLFWESSSCYNLGPLVYGVFSKMYLSSWGLQANTKLKLSHVRLPTDSPDIAIIQRKYVQLFDLTIEINVHILFTQYLHYWLFTFWI